MVFYILLSVSVFYILNRVFNLSNLFNPLNFVIIFHFIFFYLGLFYKDIFHHIDIPTSTVFLVNYSFLFILLGGVFSRYIFQKTNNNYIRFPKVDIKMDNNSAIIGFIFVLIGLICTIKYTISAGGIILFMDDVENVRIAKREGSGLIIQLAINFFTYGLLTIIMIKSSILFKSVFIVLIFFFIISFGNRGPALFLMVFLMYILQAVNRKQFSLKKIAFYGLILFSLMVLFGSLRTNYQASLYELFKARFAWRPFVNIQNFQYVLDYFPKKHDFLYGTTYLKDFSMILPGSHPNSGTYLKNLMDLKFDGGSITPSYIGISYVNFGYLGLIFSPFLLGFFSNSIYEVYVKNVNMSNPSNLILLILISFNFAAIISSGVMTVLIQNMTIIFIVHIIYVMLQNVLSRTKL